MRYRECRGVYYLNKYWVIVENGLLNIPFIYKGIMLGECIIMPSHIHAIYIDEETNKAIINRPYGLLSNVSKWCKQRISKQLHELWLTECKRQRSFYDHVIRNEQDFVRIQEYIQINPYKQKNNE